MPPAKSTDSPGCARHEPCFLAAKPIMRTFVAGFAALPLLVAVASAAQTPVFPGGAERVVVDVVVTDGEGQPVAGLTREDFVVEDEGAPQTITEFEAVDLTGPPPATEPVPPAPTDVATNDAPASSPRSVLIVFDDLNLSPASGKRVAESLRKFLRGAGTVGGDPSLEIVHEVRRADGSVAARSAPRPLAAEGTGAHADAFKLTLHRPGEYELRLVARDRRTGAEAVARQRFTVTAALSGS
jgi:hypothetical protein